MYGDCYIVKRAVDATPVDVCLFTVLTELDGHRAALEKTAAKETELFTPQQYEATFERRLFRTTLGLDIRLTQGKCKQNICLRVKQLINALLRSSY